MYKHILIPTDGSATAEKAVKAGLKFAKWAKARVTVFTAMPEYRTPTAAEVASRNVLSIAEHERRSREQAQKKRCDLIFIGSHGRTGLSALLLGSQTHEVLSRSRIPTLVYR